VKEETKGIPICPYCRKPTKRQEGISVTTLAYYPPVYDESGRNINPDRNISTRRWRCLECGMEYID